MIYSFWFQLTKGLVWSAAFQPLPRLDGFHFDPPCQWNQRFSSKSMCWSLDASSVWVWAMFNAHYRVLSVERPPWVQPTKILFSLARGLSLAPTQLCARKKRVVSLITCFMNIQCRRCCQCVIHLANNCAPLSRTQTPQGQERSAWLCLSPASCVGLVLCFFSWASCSATTAESSSWKSEGFAGGG